MCINNNNEKILKNIKILTGIQSNDIPHLGNILGVIIPTINIVNKTSNKSFVFIANLHSITQIKNRILLKKNIYKTAAVWIAFGLNIENVIFYKQSDVPEVTELAWYLSCFTPYKRLILSHSFKSKKKYLKDINTGLFIYPILMAADILLFEAQTIPVGKDQLQHLEITRIIAKRFNNNFAKKIFSLPKASLIKNITPYVPGTNGEKMSKSKNNIINIFANENELKKQIMSIKSTNKSMNNMNVNNDIVLSIYKLLANKKDFDIMEYNYLYNNQYGYNNAKNDLYKLILYKFSKERKIYNKVIKNEKLIENFLYKGAIKAKKIANKKLNEVKYELGLLN